MLNDPLQLFMNELYTAQARLLQPLNLSLHQQLKGHLGHKKCWSRTLQGKAHTHTDILMHTHTHGQIYYLPALPSNERISAEFKFNKLHDYKSGGAHRSIADGSEDIELSQSSQGVYGLQSAAEGLMEYVTDPSAPAAVEEMGSAVTSTTFLSAVCQQS